jgi:expansin
VKTKGPGGSWMTATRTDYNTWIINRDVGNGPFSVRMTDVYGHTGTATHVKLIPNKRQITSVRLTGGAAAPAAPAARVAKKSVKKATVKPSPSVSPSASPPTLESTEAAPLLPTDPPVDLAAAQTPKRCD